MFLEGKKNSFFLGKEDWAWTELPSISITQSEDEIRETFICIRPLEERECKLVGLFVLCFVWIHASSHNGCQRDCLKICCLFHRRVFLIACELYYRVFILLHLPIKWTYWNDIKCSMFANIKGVSSRFQWGWKSPVRFIKGTFRDKLEGVFKL